MIAEYLEGYVFCRIETLYLFLRQGLSDSIRLAYLLGLFDKLR